MTSIRRRRSTVRDARSPAVSVKMPLLAPDSAEAVLDGKQGPEATLARVLEPLLLE